VGSQNVEVSLEEAWKIQQARIRQAQAEDMIPLVFRDEGEEPGSYGRRLIVARGPNGRSYRRYPFSEISPIEGPTYYCVVEQQRFGAGTDATPQFQVFNIPEPEDQVTVDEQDTVSASDAAAKLREAWGSGS